MRVQAWLRRCRLDRGLSMRAFAARLTVPHSFVGKVETGERRLDVVEFTRYCRALGVDPHQGVRVAEGDASGAKRSPRRLLAAESRTPCRTGNDKR